MRRSDPARGSSFPRWWGESGEIPPAAPYAWFSRELVPSSDWPLVTIHLPTVKFTEIEAAIEKSRRLLDLTEGWDGEKAKPIEESTWKRAEDFLLRMAFAVHTGYSLALAAPRISACRDGSIDLFWKTESFRLLVNIRPDGEGDSDFFGETQSGLNIKGTFRPKEHELGHVFLLLRGSTVSRIAGTRTGVVAGGDEGTTFSLADIFGDIQASKELWGRSLHRSR